jgi:hypothetical protein
MVRRNPTSSIFRNATSTEPANSAGRLMATAGKLTGFTSRKPGPGVPTRLANGADERVISVRISAALFGLSRFWRMPHGTNLSLPGNQMPVAAQHPYRVAAPRAVKRFEQAREESLALRARSGLASNEKNAHRRCPACWCVVRAGKMSAGATKACEIVHRSFVARDKWT